MGPPPLPPQIALSASGDSRGRDKEGMDVTEKYRKLKRKYFELEEVRYFKLPRACLSSSIN